MKVATFQTLVAVMPSRVARVSFQTKTPNLGKFWRALEWEMLLYILAIWNILWSFGIIYGSLV
jgi:hypothetical protein